MTADQVEFMEWMKAPVLGEKKNQVNAQFQFPRFLRYRAPIAAISVISRKEVASFFTRDA